MSTVFINALPFSADRCTVGNSNFGKKHLEDLLSTSPKYVPAVNQIDLHPFMARTELVEYCESKKIVLEAWAPLVRGERFDHPVVVELAKKYGKSPAQVLIRYGLDRVDRLLSSLSMNGKANGFACRDSS